MSANYDTDYKFLRAFFIIAFTCKAVVFDFI